MARKKGGGGKLNRSEILQTRLDPKLRMGAEILARSQRRTLSSLIETLIEEAITKTKVPAVIADNAQIDVFLDDSPKRQEITIKKAIDLIWCAEEADRFALFALILPDFLTTNEDLLWFHLKTIPYFWAHFPITVESKTGRVLEKQSWPLINQKGLVKEHLREQWPILKDILEDKKSIEDFRLIASKLPDGPTIDKPQDYPHDIKRINYNVD